MRVLLAIDGSPSAAAACQLTASLPWPGGSVIHVLGVAEDEDPSRLDEPDVDFNRAVWDAVELLRSAGLNVRRLVVAGRPASMIVDVAIDLRAELVIVGSRGRGPLRSMLLGSVSAEVVDHAPCPVLVVRGPSITRALVAVDGSSSAHGAIDYLASTRVLCTTRVEVLSVAPARMVLQPELLVPMPAMPERDTRTQDVTEDRLRAEVQAAQAADVLARTGHDVRWSVATGGPAHEILAAADAYRSDLIVMGSRGLSGLSRLVLGSVARNVLLHTHASVLIVHEPIREGSLERVRLPSRVATSVEPG